MNHQQNILRYLQTVEQATLVEIGKGTGISYYCNTEKHLGAVMSRMVKRNMVERVKPGTFRMKHKPMGGIFSYTLPPIADGKKCGDCAYSAKCKTLFGGDDSNTSCQFSPSRFKTS